MAFGKIIQAVINFLFLVDPLAQAVKNFLAGNRLLGAIRGDEKLQEKPDGGRKEPAR